MSIKPRLSKRRRREQRHLRRAPTAVGGRQCERLRIAQLEIIDDKTRLAQARFRVFANRARARRFVGGGTIERAQRGGGGAKRSEKLRRVCALGGRKIIVAGTFGQAVGGARGFAFDNVDFEIQLRRHRLDDAQLLQILAPENRASGRKNVEQFANRRRHAGKKSGAARAAQIIDKRRRDFDLLRARIKNRIGRRENKIGEILAREFFAIGGERARIRRKILARAELQRIDINRNRDAIGGFARAPREQQMPFVQAAHRRRQRERFRAQRAPPTAGGFDVARDFHAASRAARL